MKKLYEKIFEISKNNQKAVVVTIVETKGHSPADAGAKMIFTANEEKYGTVGGGALEFNAEKQCKELLKTGQNLLKTYILDTKDLHHKHELLNMACGGSATLFFEIIGKRENVLIFGGGHIGKALMHHFSPLDFNINVFDSREEIRNEFKNIMDLSHLNDELLNTEPYIIIATHSHDFDYEVLKNILAKEISTKYIGMVASINKFKEMKKQLKNELNKELDFGNIYAPVGLNIGGRSPHEIALAIISEILTIKYKKDKIIHLRDK